MKRILIPVALLMVLVSIAVTGAAQKSLQPRRVRARPPKFEQEDVSRVFFDDLFERLVGARPTTPRNSSTPKAVTTPAETPGSMPRERPGSTTGTDAWSQIITATTLEDEIKLLKLNVDKTVTTPSSFAGLGHKTARLDFTLLAMLFAIVDQFDGDVRWKDNAPLARDLFARTALNLKAGGSIQVYNESKKRKQDLDDLVRGSRLQGTGKDETVWNEAVDRSSLMSLLESRFEANLKRWTSNSAEIRSHEAAIVREAELTAAIGAVLHSEGMDDADDDDYRPLAEMLKRGGIDLARAAKVQDEDFGAVRDGRHQSLLRRLSRHLPLSR